MVMLVAGTAGLCALVLVYQARSRPVTLPAPTRRMSVPLDAAVAALPPSPVVAAEPDPAPPKPRSLSGLPTPRFLPRSQPPQPAPPAPPPTPRSRPESTAPLVDRSRSAPEQARAIYDALGIAPEQRTQIKQVLDIQRDRFQEIRQQWMARQIDERAFGEAIRELRAETDANLTGILGAEGVKAWRSYQREVGKSLGPSIEKMLEP
jgi:hypothetical protein